MQDVSLRVTTYFRHDGQFTPLEEFTGPILDPDYVEGALLVSAYGKELFNQSLWDYIDQLWAYLVDGVCAIAAGDSYSCYFPDQPVCIQFSIITGDRVKIFVGDGEGRMGVVDKRQFIFEFGGAAIQFFSRMIAIVPEDRDIFEKYVWRISKIMGLSAE